jgi:hypothetical protein
MNILLGKESEQLTPNAHFTQTMANNWVEQAFRAGAVC